MIPLSFCLCTGYVLTLIFQLRFIQDFHGASYHRWRKRRQEEELRAGLMRRVACAVSILFTSWAVATLIISFLRNILSDSIHILLSYYCLNIYPFRIVNAKLAIGQLQFVTPPPIGDRYLISDVTNVVRLRI